MSEKSVRDHPHIARRIDDTRTPSESKIVNQIDLLACYARWRLIRLIVRLQIGNTISSICSSRNPRNIIVKTVIFPTGNRPEFSTGNYYSPTAQEAEQEQPCFRGGKKTCRHLSISFWLTCTGVVDISCRPYRQIKLCLSISTINLFLTHQYYQHRLQRGSLDK